MEGLSCKFSSILYKSLEREEFTVPLTHSRSPNSFRLSTIFPASGGRWLAPVTSSGSSPTSSDYRRGRRPHRRRRLHRLDPPATSACHPHQRWCGFHRRHPRQRLTQQSRRGSFEEAPRRQSSTTSGGSSTDGQPSSSGKAILPRRCVTTTAQALSNSGTRRGRAYDFHELFSVNRSTESCVRVLFTNLNDVSKAEAVPCSGGSLASGAAFDNSNVLRRDDGETDWRSKSLATGLRISIRLVEPCLAS